MSAPSTPAPRPAPELELRLLGPMEVWRSGARAPLPRSKKARALLAYLAVTGRAHSRGQLCDLFWDLTDDPRGALRWSLSKLRRVVNDQIDRIEADRERVSFAPRGARVDALELGRAASGAIDALSTEALEELAVAVRGEFLEGLELPDSHAFQAWCVAQREQAREAGSAVLAELVQRLAGDPRRALPHARARVHADALNVPARIDLLRILLAADRGDEAQQQLRIARRLFAEVDPGGTRQLELAWRELSRTATAPAAAPDAPPAPAPEAPAAPAPVTTDAPDPFVGRTAELERLRAILTETRARGTHRIVLIVAEPGGGKSHLATRFTEEAAQSGSLVLAARAYEAESSRPFGPWMDALGTELDELVPGAADESGAFTRESVFSAVADATATRAAREEGAVLLLDDIQWIDRDSAELLHAVVRVNRQRPLVTVLLARSGELADNEPMLRVLRGLRREHHVEEIELAPLGLDEVRELVAGYPGVDPARVFEASAGNPLYALELARAAAADPDETPRTLTELVRARMERLPADAADVLRWCAVLGQGTRLERLEALSSLDIDALAGALETLERHGLLRADARGRGYGIAHDVVRNAVYGDLSHARRRLMHRRAAHALEGEATDPRVATEVARHASLAGDARLGVQACITAGRESLRVCANGEAESLARRGLHLVEDLDRADRVAATLELLHVQYAARTPELDQAAARLRPLIEEALDLGLAHPARLGFQMLSYLRWETGSMADAHRLIMRAERISRSEDPGDRAVALSQAAKCLVLLERDVPLAESWLLEAEALATRAGRLPSSMRFAVGMLHERRGESARAGEAFEEARELARQQGDRLGEVGAVEQLAMLELDLGHHARATELAGELVELTARVREGAEAAHARGLLALARRHGGEPDTLPDLEEAMEALRVADSKYRLAYLMTRLALLELERGEPGAARHWAMRALDIATDIRRASEIVLARVALVRCAEASEEPEAAAEQLDLLRAVERAELTDRARRELEALVDGG